MTAHDVSDVVVRAKAAVEERCSSCDEAECGWQDMAFAETCRELVPELVAEVERLQAELRRARGWKFGW